VRSVLRTLDVQCPQIVANPHFGPDRTDGTGRADNRTVVAWCMKGSSSAPDEAEAEQVRLRISDRGGALRVCGQLARLSILTISYKLPCVMSLRIARVGSCCPCRPPPMLCWSVDPWR
jgi:hypothetical protein